MKYLLLVTYTLLLFSCNSNSQTSKSSQKFKFNYLETENHKIDDSTKVLLKLYFNKINYLSTTKLLKNIKSYDSLSNDLNFYFNNLLKQKQVLLRDRKDLKLLRDEIDSAFYEKFTTEQLKFLSETYYKKLDDINFTRNGYENTGREIRFHYRKEFLFEFHAPNTIIFNVGFINLTSKNIKKLKGKLFISSKNNESILTIIIDSNYFVRKITPRPLDSKPLYLWEDYVTKTWSGTQPIELQFDSDQYNYFLNHKDDLIVTFLPTKIEYEV